MRYPSRPPDLPEDSLRHPLLGFLADGEPSFAAGAQEVVDVAVGIGCCLVEILSSASLESCGAPWPVVVYGREVVRELPERILDGARVLTRVGGEADGDVADAVWPAPEHVDQVVGVLRLASVRECEGLEDGEGSRPAHGDSAANGFSLQRVAGQGDFVTFVEGEFQSGGDECAEVAFKVVDAAARESAWDRWQQEVDGDAEAGELPALRCRAAVFVV